MKDFFIGMNWLILHTMYKVTDSTVQTDKILMT